ncbi:MAG: 4-hydroxyphenylpyruvate dioxygenase [Bdellovibrionaceae bacterium]|nr:4-hydroxyphenylpyruvate dioxygenase [Bdellovibrionales bacterium]MCB9086310.1 4-hydroxyphenylpyruvate dioxygenase [Pseudobdellovibrionaceae bacterium]
MSATENNPIALNGMEFVEFASPDPMAMANLFEAFGFKKIGQHRRKKVSLYRQNESNLILNEDPNSFSVAFAKEHGPCISATGWRVDINGKEAQDVAASRGAKPLEGGDASGHSFPGIYGIGNSAVYFVDKYGGDNIYDGDFEYTTDDKVPSGSGLMYVDHMTNNVPSGEMQKWCDFYEQVFGFRDIRFFDIKGESTGLISKVMRSPCGKITIPINEPTDGKSQIQEYLDEYHGSGIQHLAFLTNDIISTIKSHRQNDIRFLDVPDTYYEAVPDRLPNVTEDLGVLQDLKVLVDGDSEGYLLQMFTENIIGPIFFEIIQRKNHQGFGEGNFQALFDAIERDQRRRGYLK